MGLHAESASVPRLQESEQDVAAKLEQYKRRIQKAQTDKARAEATLEALEKQEAETLAELEKLGVSPEELDSEIKRLEQEIRGKLAQVEELLPTS